MTKLQKYLDDLMAWAKRSLQRLRRGRRRPRRPRGRKPRGRRRKPRDRSGARTLAVMAARRGWRSAQRVTTQRVQKEGKVKSTLRAVRVRARPGAVRLALVRRRSGWKVKATARKGARRATARVGRGWIAKDTKRKSWFAARSMVAFNRQLAERTEQDLKRWASTRTGGSNESQIRGQINRSEQQGDQQLRRRLQGLDMRLEIKRARGNDEKTQIKGVIEPNYYEWVFSIEGDGLKPIKDAVEQRIAANASGRYNAMLGFLRSLARQNGAQVKFSDGGSDSDFYTSIRVHYTKGDDSLTVYLNRQGEGMHNPRVGADGQIIPGVGTMTGRELPYRSHTQKGNTSHKTVNSARPHDAISSDSWRDYIGEAASETWGVEANNSAIKSLVKSLKKQAKNPGNSFMVGDGLSSQSPIYPVKGGHPDYADAQGYALKDGRRAHVSVEGAQGSINARDRVSMAHGNNGQLVLALIPGSNPANPKYAEVDRDDFQGNEWKRQPGESVADHRQRVDDQVAPRIDLAMEGLQQAYGRLNINGMTDELAAKLPEFWAKLAAKARSGGMFSP